MDADEDEIKEGAGYSVLTRTLQSLKAFMKYGTKLGAQIGCTPAYLLL